MAKKYQHRVGDAIGGGMLFKEKTQHNTACFVAGTLVHTKDGLKPIQEIKVGDMVLSKPENGEGEAEYKPVLSTFKSPVKEKIYKVEYFNETAQEDYDANGLNYLFCTANHPFWVSRQPTADINATLKGTWTASEKLKTGYLSSLHGDTLRLEAYPVLPVRTLPNFPEGCAYTQHLDEKPEWLEEEFFKTEWNDEDFKDVVFVKFDDKYQLVALTNQPKSDALVQLNKDYDVQLKDPADIGYTDTNTLVDQTLFNTLTMRMVQDIDPATHTKEKFCNDINLPLMSWQGNEVVAENKIADLEACKLVMQKIEQYGDCTGLTEKSLHERMRKPDAKCPNPFEDYVYNIEVADHHTYFVGHDAVWVHNCNPSNSHAVKFLNHTC